MLRHLTVGALLVLALLWSGTLVVVGMLVASGSLPGWLGAARAGGLVGWALMLAGQFVFLVIIADRLAPGAHRALRAGVETCVGALVALASLGALALVIGDMNA